VAIRAMVVLTVILGVIYPLVMTGVGQLTMPAKANGSMITSDGTPVGSSLIGQSFTDAKGNPLPQWFQSRPSAAGDGYDAEASSPSNLGPNNPDLVKAIEERKAEIERIDGVSGSGIPADALTASGSGLDPHISPAYALVQVDAVAKARGLSTTKVEALVKSMIQGRDLGYLGEPTVNVLQLNLALSKMDPAGDKG
jgi:K+-transporting ATPase ATPase C chain